MINIIDKMSNSKINNTIKNLRANNFEVYFVENTKEAYNVFRNEIYNRLEPKTLSYGDSVTMHKTGVLDLIKNDKSVEFVDTFNEQETWRDQIASRKRALTVDLFITGTNAVTENGQLVNLDMIGNRVAALTFGPRDVTVFVGVNKIVPSLDEAFKRVRSVAAPMNSKAHEGLNVPCQKTGQCHDCSSPHRICNTWSITEKAYPKNRIKVVLINECLGY